MTKVTLEQDKRSIKFTIHSGTSSPREIYYSKQQSDTQRAASLLNEFLTFIKNEASSTQIENKCLRSLVQQIDNRINWKWKRKTSNPNITFTIGTQEIPITKDAWKKLYDSTRDYSLKAQKTSQAIATTAGVLTIPAMVGAALFFNYTTPIIQNAFFTMTALNAGMLTRGLLLAGAVVVAVVGVAIASTIVASKRTVDIKRKRISMMDENRSNNNHLDSAASNNKQI